MSLPPLPTTLEQMGRRPFSFYPPVINVDHNEWLFVKATWSEVLVVNTKSQTEVWVPRRFLGEVSRVDEPVMIVGLKRELEYKAGSLWPHERRVIEMPKAVNDYSRPPSATDEPLTSPASVVGIRLENDSESRIGRLIVAALILGVVLCFVVVLVFRGHEGLGNITFVPVVQRSLGLTQFDDYKGVVRKLGEPKEDRWQSETGQLQYRVLRYPELNIYVVMMGKDRESARYIGALDDNWKPVDSVDLPRAGNTRSMLKKLSRF